MPLSERKAVALTRSTSPSTASSLSRRTSLRFLKSAIIDLRYSNAANDLPSERELAGSMRSTLARSRSSARMPMSSRNAALDSSNSHGSWLTVWKVSDKSFKCRNKSMMPTRWMTNVMHESFRRLFSSSVRTAPAAVEICVTR